MRISLSLWSVDQACVAEEIRKYDPLVDSFHVDVMDGRFADNLLFGPLVVETLRALTGRQIVVHLMVIDPARWVTRFAEAGADVLVVHALACADFPGTINEIRAAGLSAGAAIGLDESSAPIRAEFTALSVVLILGTPIGVKGLPFNETALDAVREMTAERAPGRAPAVMVDGGIRWSSIPRIAAAGADGVVAGSILTSAPDPAAASRAIVMSGS